MKKALLLLLCSITAVTLYGQGFVVSCDKVAVAYEGVENPLTVAVEHCSCKDIKLITENGTMTSDAPCHYLWTPRKTGRAVLLLNRRSANGLTNVDTILYRVKPLPVPKVVLHKRFYAMEGRSVLSLLYEGFDFEVPWVILDFKIEFLRNGELLYSAQNKGATLDAITKAKAANLYPQDIIRITNIRYQGPDKIIRTIATGIHQTLESITNIQW